MFTRIKNFMAYAAAMPMALLAALPAGAQSVDNAADAFQKERKYSVDNPLPPPSFYYGAKKAMEYADRLSGSADVRAFVDATGSAVHIGGWYEYVTKQGKKPDGMAARLKSWIQAQLGHDAGDVNRPRIDIDLLWTGVEDDSDDLVSVKNRVSAHMRATPTVGSHFPAERVKNFTSAIGSYTDTSLSIAESHADQRVIEELEALQKGAKKEITKINELFTKVLLKQIFPDGDFPFIEESYPYLKKYMDKFEINTPLRIAHFLAQVGVEIGYFVRRSDLKENLNYSSCAIKRNVCQRCYSSDCTRNCELCEKSDCFMYKSSDYNENRFDMCEYPEKYARNPEKIAIAAYNGFIGRGFIHLTGKNNYKEIYSYLVSKNCNPKPFLIEATYLSNDLETAAMSACAFFEKKGGNKQADQDSFKGVMKIVNAKDTNETQKEDLLKSIKIILNVK